MFTSVKLKENRRNWIKCVCLSHYDELSLAGTESPFRMQKSWCKLNLIWEGVKELLRLKGCTAHVTEIWSHKNVWKQCPLHPLFSQPHYPIENVSSASSHAAPFSENKRSRMDLGSVKWADRAWLYRWDHFIHFWWQFTNMQNWEPSTSACEPHDGVPPAF